MLSKYQLLGVVGEGAYGVVLKCENRDTGALVAIKKFKESEDDEVVRKTTHREVKILRTLSDQTNIVELKEAFRRKGKLYLVFEYVDRNLLEVMESYPRGMDPLLVRLYMYQLLNAVRWTHQNHVLHRDIKPENLLVDTSSHVLKLCDFGFARFSHASPNASASDAAVSSSSLTSTSDPSSDPYTWLGSLTSKYSRSKHPNGNPGNPYTDYVATRWYRSPELLVGDPHYSEPIDVWATGCIMGELLDGQPAFPGESEIDQLYIIQKTLGPLTRQQEALFLRNPRFAGYKFPDMTRPAGLSSKYRSVLDRKGLELLRGLLHMDPKKRLRPSEALAHPYFADISPARLQAFSVAVRNGKSSDIWGIHKAWATACKAAPLKPSSSSSSSNAVSKTVESSTSAMPASTRSRALGMVHSSSTPSLRQGGSHSTSSSSTTTSRRAHNKPSSKPVGHHASSSSSSSSSSSNPAVAATRSSRDAINSHINPPSTAASASVSIHPTSPPKQEAFLRQGRKSSSISDLTAPPGSDSAAMGLSQAATASSSSSSSSSSTSSRQPAQSSKSHVKASGSLVDQLLQEAPPPFDPKVYSNLPELPSYHQFRQSLAHSNKGPASSATSSSQSSSPALTSTTSSSSPPPTVSSSKPMTRAVKARAVPGSLTVPNPAPAQVSSKVSARYGGPLSPTTTDILASWMEAPSASSSTSSTPASSGGPTKKSLHAHHHKSQHQQPSSSSTRTGAAFSRAIAAGGMSVTPTPVTFIDMEPSAQASTRSGPMLGGVGGALASPKASSSSKTSLGSRRGAGGSSTGSNVSRSSSRTSSRASTRNRSQVLGRSSSTPNTAVAPSWGAFRANITASGASPNPVPSYGVAQMSRLSRRGSRSTSQQRMSGGSSSGRRTPNRDSGGSVGGDLVLTELEDLRIGAGSRASRGGNSGEARVSHLREAQLAESGGDGKGRLPRISSAYGHRSDAGGMSNPSWIMESVPGGGGGDSGGVSGVGGGVGMGGAVHGASGIFNMLLGGGARKH